MPISTIEFGRLKREMSSKYRASWWLVAPGRRHIASDGRDFFGLPDAIRLLFKPHEC
jgi:hypothetical protein